MLGIMIDCSRNAVMKPSKVKEYADYMSKFGYDTLMLYTEDTYEIEGEPYFGYMRGQFTQQQLKEIDDYASVAIRSLAGQNIITGTPDGSFMPKANTTRAQAAALILRALDFMTIH